MASARRGRRLQSLAARSVDKIAGTLVFILLKLLRLINRRWVSALTAWFMRAVGPHLHEHQLGRDNLKAAFPDKSSAEIERILLGVWDNLGRVGGEFAHLDRLCAG